MAQRRSSFLLRNLAPAVNPFRQALAGLLLVLPAACCCFAQTDFQREPISYETAPVDDAVARLKAAIESGEVELAWHERLGWLPAVLDELGVPVESQTLVFSKTSLQRRKISPRRPRALYFNDDVYVGYVRYGDVLELSAVDPHLGAVFYTIDQRDAERPKVTRDPGHCLVCHASNRTKGVPGYLVRSVFPDSSGEPHLQLGTTTTDHTTPFEERFGGWYVTGRHGEARHRGNAIADADTEPPIDPEPGANLASLEGRVSTERYPAETSDLVALMVLEHQTQAHNLITKAAYTTRQAIHYDEILRRGLGRPEGERSESVRRRIDAAAEALVEYLLFSGEAELPSPVRGSSVFAERFAAQGPCDSRGRSLRDFDLQRRLFRYPCSFLVYSDSIDALPDPVRERLAERLTAVLTGADQSAAYAHLSEGDRAAVLEILRDTKPGLLAE